MRAGSKPSLSEELARWASSLTPADLPVAVVEDARWRLIDTVGVALAGSQMDYAVEVESMARAMGGRPDATVIGFGSRLPAALAGYVNGALAHGPDFDDTHSVAMVHIGCIAVPPALAMAERIGSPGAEMLTALVAGAEIGLRIAAAAPQRFHWRGYHATGVVGAFTAAVAAGRLLGLDESRLANALGLAGSQAGGLLQGLHDGSWVKRLHPAFAAQSGIMCAQLAEHGFTGPGEVLEGKAGLYSVLLREDEGEVRPENVLETLGERWLLPETTYKPYPNGAWNHSSMDAVRSVMEREALSHEDVTRVVCRVPKECVPIVCEPRELKLHPETPYHMKFSLPYSIAILAVLGHCDVADYNSQTLADPTIAAFAGRVECELAPDLGSERFPARVEVITRDGRRLHQEMPAQRGGPGSPMSPDDHRRKFRGNARPALGAEGAERLLAALEEAWSAPGVSSIARATVAGA